MTTRLVALVLIPVTVMGALVGVQVVPRWRTAGQADAVQAQVGALGGLVELHSALASRRFLAAFAVRIGELGMTVQQTSDLVGVDLEQLDAAAAARVHRAVTTLGATAPVGPDEVRRLDEAYAAGSVTAQEAADRYGALARQALAAGAEHIGRLQVLADDMKAQSLIGALQSLRVANGILIDVASPQGIDLSAVWYPAPTARPEDVQRTFARLVSNQAVYHAGMFLLRDLGVPAVVDGLDRIAGDARVRVFETAMNATINGDRAAPAVEGPVISAVFAGYLARVGLLDELVATTATVVGDEARALAAAQRQELLTWTAIAALVAVGSVTIAVASGRSIARPLQVLARYAQRVNEGELHTDPGMASRYGPREARLAVSVLTDLAANLRLLDRKAHALATCSLDDPALQEPLPGRLGRSLDSSAALLSGSIAERNRLESSLLHEATHDGLTGVANRAAALTRLHDAVQRSRRTGDTIAIIHVDLNDFTAVNDRHGHASGDEVLRQTASRLLAGVRGADLVARLGSDEFAIVSEGVADADAAIELARRIIELISQPVELGEATVAIGAAVGIALAGRDGGSDDPQRLLAHADAAVHRAKGNVGSAIEVFDADLQRQLLEREDVERALTAALADPDGGGLVLHYQPVVSTTTGHVRSVEALVRWNRRGHGLQRPDAFIPIAEATSLVIELDRWVLGAAVRQLQAWADDPRFAELPIAVNISGRHLASGELASDLAALLATSGIEPHRLTIEITETVLLEDLTGAAAELNAVRALGVQVALDDFGTGYTSLAHLHHLPVDVVKIDRSFTQQIGNRRGRALVRTVTDLGHAADHQIVAEGVETDEELAALRELGTDAVQGYLLARPLDSDALGEWVRDRAAVDTVS